VQEKEKGDTTLYPFLTGRGKQINKVAKQCATNGVHGRGHEFVGGWGVELLCRDEEEVDGDRDEQHLQ